MSNDDPEKEINYSIPDLDTTIHAPARLAILALLAVVESADFKFLLRQTGLTRGNLSTHLIKLEEAGYVSIKKEFVDRIPRTLISMTNQGQRAIQVYSQSMQQVVDQLLVSKK